ncbi:unnamed protein product [Ceratitis capitata]|uniref:(Mediterranean fruit fly) hypothetical protein n=1 Tax=Ceratitis capitata TaxID=7213 RepID=A0A811UTA1_CERCA|nr:unnamed protein product [Ceratitis capitata]
MADRNYRDTDIEIDADKLPPIKVGPNENRLQHTYCLWFSCKERQSYYGTHYILLQIALAYTTVVAEMEHTEFLKQNLKHQKRALNSSAEQKRKLVAVVNA